MRVCDALCASFRSPFCVSLELGTGAGTNVGHIGRVIARTRDAHLPLRPRPGCRAQDRKTLRRPRAVLRVAIDAPQRRVPSTLTPRPIDGLFELVTKDLQRSVDICRLGRPYTRSSEGIEDTDLERHNEAAVDAILPLGSHCCDGDAGGHTGTVYEREAKRRRTWKWKNAQIWMMNMGSTTVSGLVSPLFLRFGAPAPERHSGTGGAQIGGGWIACGAPFVRSWCIVWCSFPRST